MPGPVGPQDCEEKTTRNTKPLLSLFSLPSFRGEGAAVTCDLSGLGETLVPCLEKTPRPCCCLKPWFCEGEAGPKEADLPHACRAGPERVSGSRGLRQVAEDNTHLCGPPSQTSSLHPQQQPSAFSRQGR